MSATVDIKYDSSEGGSLSDEDMLLDRDEDVTDDDMMSADDDSSGEDVQGSDGETKKGSLSNVLQNLLKKRPGQKTIIMAKAKTDKQILATKQDEGKGNGSDEDSDKEVGKRLNSYQQRQKKLHWEEMNRDRPNVLNKDYERNLQKIATRGVVQLFNAVRKQQKVITEKMEEAGGSIRRKDNAMSAISKGDFLDILQGHKVKIEPKVEVKDEVKEEIKDEPNE